MDFLIGAGLLWLVAGGGSKPTYGPEYRPELMGGTRPNTTSVVANRDTADRVADVMLRLLDFGREVYEDQTKNQTQGA